MFSLEMTTDLYVKVANSPKQVLGECMVCCKNRAIFSQVFGCPGFKRETNFSCTGLIYCFIDLCVLLIFTV